MGLAFPSIYLVLSGNGRVVPALLTRISSFPYLDLICSKAFSIESSLVRSSCTNSSVLFESGVSFLRVSIASVPFSTDREPRRMLYGLVDLKSAFTVS